MNSTSPSAFDLGQILADEGVVAHFQPIVSVRKKTIVGYEGLSRGIHPISHEMIAPQELFAEAGLKSMVLDLDRLCRKTVLENFCGIERYRSDRLLSLNFEASIIDQGVVGSGNLIQQVTSLGLNPQVIAIEIIESNVRDTQALEEFIQTYRDYGFLIALDDVGAGHSNLNRIPLLKPDILKIDRYLVHNIARDFHKQEVFKSLVGLAHRIGALIVAEGVETEEEALFVTELGVDMLQGFYFDYPHASDQMDDQAITSQMNNFPQQFKQAIVRRLTSRHSNLKKYETMTRRIQVELSKLLSAQFDQKLTEMIRYFPMVECFYVLNEEGFQVSQTVFAKADFQPKNRLIFRPAEIGSDHTMKDYYYMLMDGVERMRNFVTEPYLSLATGNPCITFARTFKDASGKIRILCVDINTQHL